MKTNLMHLILVAVIASGITIGVNYFFQSGDKTIKIEHVSTAPVTGVLYSSDERGEFKPVDFTVVAAKVMDGVVHIRSSQTLQNSQENRFEYREAPDQFHDFFGDDLFKRFFGPDFRDQTGPKAPNVRSATGSGVIINEEGYIVTNNHVIADADEIEVTLHDNRSFMATVIGTDPSTDLALIQIKEKNLPKILIANSDEVKIGEWVLAIGNPFNLNSTVTAGIISAKSRNINILRDQYAVESFLQTDAAINPGNSGGALVNLQGGLIGINTAIASPTGSYAGYGFAVPSNIVNKVVEDLLKFGTVQRGYLGVMIRGVNGNLAKEKDLSVITGVYVDSVSANSAARDAGMKEGDVILELNNEEVKTAPELQELLARHRPGDKVTMKIDRDGKSKQISVTLKNREGSTAYVSGEKEEVLKILGVALENVNKETARKLDIEGGARVTKLYPGKLRRNTDMREGFIITSVDGKKVSSVDQLTKLLEDKKGGVLLEGIYEDYPGVYYYAFGL